MTRRMALSRGEAEVAGLLWKLKLATVRELHAQLQTQKPIEFTTVQTYLRRLEAKGYVESELQGRSREYRAKVKPGTVIGEMVRDLTNRLFGGDTLPLMRHLIAEGDMDKEQLAALRKMIDDAEKGKGK